MRIGIDARMVKKTGIGEYLKNLIIELSKIDKKNRYIIFLNRKDLEDCKIKQPNFEIEIVKSAVFTLTEQIEMFFKVHSRKLDIFHSPHFVVPILCSCKTMVTIHDLILNLFPNEIGSRRARIYYNFMMASALKKANKIITVSNNTKKDITDFFEVPQEKIKVIYEAASSQYRPIIGRELIREINQKFNIAQEFLLYVGLKKPHKNLIRLIKSFEILRKKRKVDVKLVIVGKMDPRYTEIACLVGKLGLEKEVIFTGYISNDDLILLYNAARAFVFPSLYEGFGLPPLESMACGVPVVSSNAGSLVEVLGDAALVFNPLDINDMADKMYQIISDEGLREEIIEKGLKRVKKFSWEKCAEETLRVYKEVYNSKN